MRFSVYLINFVCSVYLCTDFMEFLFALKTSRKRCEMKLDSSMVRGALYRRYMINMVVTMTDQTRLRHMSLMILAYSMRRYLSGIS